MNHLYSIFAPLVSVILPTYNRAYIIKRAIDSVMKQSFKEFELIIVDDGSTDDTKDVVNEYLNRNDNIKYIKHSHRKLPLSLNKGIDAACGKFITFIGSDDEYKESHIKLRIDFLEGHPEIDLLYGGVKVIGDPYVPDKNDKSKRIHLNDCVIGGTFFGKRNMFIEMGGFKNLDYSEDSEFFDRASLKYKMMKVDFPTYIYHRDSDDSITNSQFIKK